MRKIRIQGLVRHANRVKDELSSPLSAGRLSQLECEVKGALKYAEKIFHKTNTTSKHLPSQSKKAYAFLSNIDFRSIETTEDAPTERFRPKSVLFRGISAYFTSILDRLAFNTDKEELEIVYNSIVNSSNNIENKINSESIEPEHLTITSRNIRGWLAYFSERRNFIRYTESLQRAQRAFFKYSPGDKNVVLYFCPVKALYSVRYFSDCVLLKLPTAMILFDGNHFTLLSEMIFRKENHKKELVEAMRSEPYQSLLENIAFLSGIVEKTKGIYFDLEESFNRVNSRYFAGDIKKPKLVWSRTFNCRKFGHYDFAHDIVMLNNSLDCAKVAACTIDFIMYHELLHKELGIKGNGKNIVSHNKEFKMRENMFEQIDKAKNQLDCLARNRGKQE